MYIPLLLPLRSNVQFEHLPPKNLIINDGICFEIDYRYKIRKMKTIKYLTAFVLVTVLLGSCDVRYNNGNNGMPPGQAKKIYGGSAKDYAPGQRKKQRNNTTIIVNP